MSKELDEIRKKEHRLTGAPIFTAAGEGTWDTVAGSPTGSLALDDALGVGGWPRGRIIDIYGLEGSGKTTLGLHACKEAQRRDGIACFVDMAHQLDVSYARAIGVDLERLLVTQPDTIPDALNILEMLARSGAVDTIVVDDLNHFTTGNESEEEERFKARAMTASLGKLCALAQRSGTMIIFLSGVASGERVIGYNAMRLYAHVRVDLRQTDVACLRVAKIVKNKCSPPFKTATFEIRNGSGIDVWADKLDRAVALGLLFQVDEYPYEYRTKAGSEMFYAPRGKDNWATMLDVRRLAIQRIGETPALQEQLVALLAGATPTTT